MVTDIELWNALLPLRSAASFMMTGAHPDDEASILLARLVKKDGVRVIYACATRGQGGQNALGPEAGKALAAIRTREMEEAARVLDMEVHWLDLPDFGFAKTAEATLAAWGRDRLLERLVRAIRTARPDVLCPTFLDVPGQHGHHRAITQATIAAFDLAADPDSFPEHIAVGLPAWRVGKLYLPALSGGGGTYDDAEPPPPATISVPLDGEDAETARRSRARHRSQGMDVIRAETLASMPLHLLRSRAPMANAETSILDGLRLRLADFADGSEPALDDALRRADAGIDFAVARFPDRGAVVTGLNWALEAIEEAETRLAPPPDPLADDLSHRLTLKRRQLWRAHRIGLSIDARVELPDVVVAGVPLGVRLSVRFDGSPASASLAAVSADGAAARSDYLGMARVVVAQPNPFQATFDPLSPAGAVTGRLRYATENLEIEQTIEPVEAPRIVPRLSLTPYPERIVVRSGSALPPLHVDARNNTGETIETRILVGETVVPLRLAAGHGTRIEVTVPTPEPGRYRLDIVADGIAHGRVRSFAYDHIGRTGWIEPAAIEVLVADVAIPDGIRVAYIDGGGDRVGVSLAQLGIDVSTLDAGDLNTDLTRFDTIVVGVRAFGTRPDLAAARERLHAFVRDGGHLVTLYHRPHDGWDAGGTPPARIEIGSPSVRWRVCDPAAPVTMRAPDHPLLMRPNRIGADDWAGWVKERGLYFASSWDQVYEPLLAISDPGEAPLEGALVSACIGAGRHTHVSLGLAHQMEELVPGAFRLFANLVQGARKA